MTWDEDNQIFWPKKPYASWVKDMTTASWKSPIGDAPALTAEQTSQNEAGTHRWSMFGMKLKQTILGLDRRKSINYKGGGMQKKVLSEKHYIMVMWQCLKIGTLTEINYQAIFYNHNSKQRFSIFKNLGYVKYLYERSYKFKLWI